jgi:hypothetical protein
MTEAPRVVMKRMQFDIVATEVARGVLSVAPLPPTYGQGSTRIRLRI